MERCRNAEYEGKVLIPRCMALHLRDYLLELRGCWDWKANGSPRLKEELGELGEAIRDLERHLSIYCVSGDDKTKDVPTQTK